MAKFPGEDDGYDLWGNRAYETRLPVSSHKDLGCILIVITERT